MVWLHSENAIFLLVSHTFSSIFSASKQILYKKIHFHPHTSIHRKFTTTYTPEPTKIHHYPHKTYHHTTQKPLKHHHPHHHNNKKKNQRSKKERLRDWGKERSVFSGNDDRSWVGRERDRSSTCTRRCMVGDWRMRGVGLGWWRREWDAGGVGLGWRSERWVLGVCGLVMSEGGVESIFAWVDWSWVDRVL